MTKEVAEIVMPLLFIIGSILMDVALLAVIVGMPLLIIYAIYRAIKGLMTHNAELKARERERTGRDV